MSSIGWRYICNRFEALLLAEDFLSYVTPTPQGDYERRCNGGRASFV